MITSQIRFVARPIWILQGALLLCLCLFLRHLTTPEQIASHLHNFLSTASILIAMTMLPFYGRARKYKMRELEVTTRMSFVRLVIAKLGAIGIGDVVCLSVIILLSFGKSTLPLKGLLLFIVIPFLLTTAGSLFILGHIREEYGIYVTIGFAIGVSALYWSMTERFGAMLLQISGGVCFVICTLLILSVVLELRRLLRGIPSENLQETLIF